MPTFDQLNRYLLYAEMFIPATNYWNVVNGRVPGEILEDAEGCQAMRVLGKNMAYLMRVLEYSREVIPPPPMGPKAWTHFIW